MSEQTPIRPGAAPSPDHDVETLFHLAGRRPHLPEAEVEPIRAAARATWHRQVGRERARQRLWIGAGLAAALLLAVGLTLRGPWGSLPPQPVATLELRSGEVTVSGMRGGSDLPLTVGEGAVIATSAGGRAALRLAGGFSLRIDSGSKVRLTSAESVTLERGALYVDTGLRAAQSGPLEIETPLGSIRHLGTQFEARLLSGPLLSAEPAPEALRVRVRDGAVLVSRDGETVAAEAGGEITLRADGRIERGSAPSHGSSWDWVQRAAPPIQIEGATLASFLAWESREMGLPWAFADSDLEAEATQVILHGSIAGLTPAEALSVVLPGCGFHHRRTETGLVLEREPES